uniref:Retrotransposon Copia-like N-terminal domain-containing protein n=1 Tax=Salix viminalis TaxID=40686 RepID=A0A6N2KIH2_SALVM
MDNNTDSTSINQNSTPETTLQNTSTLTIDPSDPLFIHTSDHPSMNLVPKALDGTNYAMWRRSMLISLSAKNKMGFINGTIITPTENDPKYMLWQRCNDLVLSWILNSLNQEIANSVLYVETPSEIWVDLQERFSQGNFSHHYQIQRSIVELQQNQDSIFTYYTKLKTLWDELKMSSPVIQCSCGGMKQLTNNEEKMRLSQFLMGLNESYSAIRGQIMLMQSLPTVKKAYSLLCEEKKQRGMAEHKINEQVHAMNVKRTGSVPQNRKWMPGSSTNQGPRKRLHCTYCEGTTYTVDKCFYLIGFPVGHALPGKNIQPQNRSQKINAIQTVTDTLHNKVSHTPAQPLQLTADELSQIKAFLQEKSTASANYSGNNNSCNSSNQHVEFLQWIIDSGATNHIATSVTDEEITPTYLNTGSANISKDLHVHDVLCAPSFQDLATKKMIGLGKLSEGLYYLMPQSQSRLTAPNTCQVTLSSTSCGTTDWDTHQHYLLSSCRNNPSFTYDSQHSCEVCPLAKQTRLLFPKSSIQSIKIFELIHCDIWGHTNLKHIRVHTTS